MPTSMPKPSHYFRRVFHGLMPLCRETEESESLCRELQISQTTTEDLSSVIGWIRDMELSKNMTKSIQNGFVYASPLKSLLLNLREPLRYLSGKVLAFIGVLEEVTLIER